MQDFFQLSVEAINDEIDTLLNCFETVMYYVNAVQVKFCSLLDIGHLRTGKWWQTFFPMAGKDSEIEGHSDYKY